MGLVVTLHPQPAIAEERLRVALAALPESTGKSVERSESTGLLLGGTWLPSAAGGLAESPRGCLLLEGMIENRRELAAQLGLEGEATSAEVALGAWERWGDPGLARLEGPFALVVWDRVERRLVAARDVLGARSLVYRRRGEALDLASDVGCLLSLPGVSEGVDETSLARLFAVKGPRPGKTYYQELEELPAGHLMELRDGRLRVTRHTSLEPTAVGSSRPDQELVEELRELLERAVHCYLPDQPFGILLSGGLDSGALACLAAEHLRARGAEPPTAFSFVFDDLPCDESDAMSAVVERHGMPWERIVSDELWPLCSMMPPPRATAPVADLYGAPQVVAQRRARARGMGVLWSGHFGDQLYVHGNLWLRELVRRGRWDAAVASIRGQRRLKRSGRPHRGLRGPLARVLLDLAPRARPLPWLTPEAAMLAGGVGDQAPPAGVRPGQWGLFADPLAHLASVVPVAQAAREGIDLRFPFHHRRLVSWALGAPAHLLYRPGAGKLVLREAMRGSMPERVRARQASTTLLPLAARGLVEKERGRAEELLSAADAWWPRFVRREWLGERFPALLESQRDGIESFMIWTCLCLEQWRRRLAAPARAA